IRRVNVLRASSRLPNARSISAAPNVAALRNGDRSSLATCSYSGRASAQRCRLANAWARQNFAQGSSRTRASSNKIRVLSGCFAANCASASLSTTARRSTSGRLLFNNACSRTSAPIAEGVPEVALVRLQALLNNNLPEVDRRAVVERLAEAQLAAKQPESTLILLEDARVRELPWAKFWRAQAFASLHRWAEALPLYEQVASDERSPFRSAATFGAAEMLRALGRRDEALKTF